MSSRTGCSARSCSPPRGARWVKLERGASARVVAAEAPRAGDLAARPDPADEVLAARLPRLALTELGDPPPLLLDFSA
ncbi:hypothetical protein OV079_29125 [Nannocystis pusilla]|uniref:Uncharacterized protein n=1 Tax=Nannocystis pusilla TaxID=889268 RepID=A0A9X3ET94_9BACT|nr:hypothetical protein [Nannocystis pusilla]MCY1009556.1 hypothetical protein [Nannocystis pusilla]